MTKIAAGRFCVSMQSQVLGRLESRWADDVCLSARLRVRTTLREAAMSGAREVLFVDPAIADLATERVNDFDTSGIGI